MIIVPIHKISFECTNDKDVELPELLWPSYVYKIGDEFKLFSILSDDTETSVSVYKVTNIEHELIRHADSNQNIIVYVERVKE